MLFEQIMFWTGVATWCLLAVLGLFQVIDKTAEFLIDSARFKTYVWHYLKNRHTVSEPE